MKSLNKILCSCALITMATSLGIGLGSEQEATVTKADGVTFQEVATTASVVSITAGYNGHASPNEAYIVMKMTEHDYPSTFPTIKYAGQDGFVASDYNFLSKISFSSDRTNWTYLSDVYNNNPNATFYVSDGSGISGNIRFALRALDGSDFRSSLTRFVRIEEGCEFPSYEYIGAGKSGEAKKFVQSETLIFDSLGFDDDGATRALRDQFGVSELTTIREFVTAPTDGGCIFLRTTNQDYEASGKSDYQNVGAANANLYNTFSNIKIDDKQLSELSDGNMVFDKWQRPGLSFGIASDKLELLTNASSITIPALTQLPSWTRNDAGAATKKIYCTENDLILNHKVLAGGHDFTSKAADSGCWYNATEVDVKGVEFENLNEQNPFVNVILSDSDYGEAGTVGLYNGLSPEGGNYAIGSFDGGFKNTNILMDNNSLAIAGEPIFNLFGVKNSFAVRFSGESQQINTSEVTIKKGAWFPSKTYFSSEQMSEPRCFIAKEDVTFKKNLLQDNNKFAKKPTNELATTETLTIGTTILRHDPNDYYLYFVPNEAATGYGNLENNVPVNLDKFSANINFLNKLHIHLYDGTVIDGDSGVFTSLSLHQWTEKGVFLKINKDILPDSKIQYVQSIRFDAGFEVASFDRSIKYQLANQVTCIYEDGSTYEGRIAPWRLDVNGNRGFGQKVSLSNAGNIDLKPHYDADSSILYLETSLYQDLLDNDIRTKCIHYISYFDLNFLGKIKLIKDGVEKPLVDLPLLDDVFINLFDRNYSNIGVRTHDNVHSYDAIKIEAGCEIPVISIEGSSNIKHKDTTLEYRTVAETKVWGLNTSRVYGEFKNVKFGEAEPISVISGNALSTIVNSLPTVPDVSEGKVGYWENASNQLIDLKHVVSDNEVYHKYESDIVTLTPASISGVNGIPHDETNLLIDLADSDYDGVTENINVASFETFSSHIELYDMDGNQLPVNTNEERYIWSNGKLLIQLKDPESSFIHRIYKIVLKSGALAPSLSLSTTGEGPTYTIDNDYTYVRFLGTDDWVLVNESTDQISTKVTALGLGVNKDQQGEPNGSYNVIVQLDEYVAGTTKNSPLMLFDASDNIHFYKEDGSEMELSYNTQQYSSWDGKGVLFQIYSEEAPTKVVLDEGMLIPSAAYVEGEGAMLELSEKAVLLKVGDVWQFVKEYTFGSETVYMTYGQAADASKVPAGTPHDPEQTDTTIYTPYWKVVGEDTEFDPTATVTKDMAFEVAYKEKAREYTVTYQDETGAEITSLAATVANGSEYSLATAAPEKVGHTFAGWEVVAGGVSISEGKFTMPTANVTVKATYTPNTYTLTVGGAEITVTYGQAIGTLPAATKEHFHDCVWKIGETTITSETVWSYTESKTATVEGVGDTHTVTFNVDGGSAVASQPVAYGGKVTVNAPTKEGYTFSGWTVGGQPVDLSTYVVEGDVTLTATWTIKSYTVTFTDGVASATVNHGAKVTKPEDPTKTGYTFGGWLLNGQPFDFESEVTGDIALTAKWTPITYTVTFDSDGGSTVAAATVAYGSKVTKPADPTMEGYTFVGWTKDGVAFNFNSTVTGNITLKAVWEKVEEQQPEESKGVSGCFGSIAATSALITLVSGLGVALIAGKKKED